RSSFWTELFKVDFSIYWLYHLSKSGGAPMSLRVLLVVAVFGPALVAQTPTGTIVGTVTDPSRAAVAGAQIEFASDQTGERRTAKTDTDGSFRVSDLPVGVYTATVV